MMKLTGNNKIVHISFILIAAIGISLVCTVLGGWAQKGSAAETDGTSNVVVAGVDYVDEKVKELNTKINELTTLMETLDKTVEAHSTSLKFENITLTAGQTLIAGDSSEIIVRHGKAQAISGKNGDGLADISSDVSKDFFTGQELPLNHLLLVSRDDGRGLKAESKQVFILFKGTYEIK